MKVFKDKNTPKHFDYNGVKLIMDRNIISPVIEQALTRGTYEGEEIKQLHKLIEPEERILEIGSGLGLMSTLAGKHESSVQVITVEANPQLIPYIQKVHEINGVQHVELISGILSNDTASGTVPFYIKENFWGSTLVKPKQNNYLKMVEVPIHNFNELILKTKPSMIICDIEGGELDLFIHANLTGVEKVLLEIHQRMIGRRGVKKIFECFAARDFHYDQYHSAGSVITFSHINRGQMRKSRIKTSQPT